MELKTKCNVSRFFDQFKRLSDFYNKCRNLQYFKYLVQVPSLPDNPPNFLVASELSNHVAPVATVVPDTDTLVDDTIDDTASEMMTSVNDERERYIDQLLTEIESLQVRHYCIANILLDQFTMKWGQNN